MYLFRPGIKENPVRRWNLPDLVFFAAGDIREPGQFLHDALPRAREDLERLIVARP